MRNTGKGNIFLLAILLFLFGLTAIWFVAAWNSSGDVEMSKHGWIAMGLGTVFSIVIGCGLMALMFYSSRSGNDEAAGPFRKKTETAIIGHVAGSGPSNFRPPCIMKIPSRRAV